MSLWLMPMALSFDNYVYDEAFTQLKVWIVMCSKLSLKKEWDKVLKPRLSTNIIKSKKRKMNTIHDYTIGVE